jgi:peptidoglycan hydrolase FlgJ
MHPATAGGYVDFSRFGALRERAAVDQAGALEAVSEEFEALFVDLMLKAARAAEMEGGLFDSQALGTYREMLDQQLALSMAAENDLGVGRLLAAQFADFVSSDADAAAAADAQAEAMQLLRLPPVPGPAERAAANRASAVGAAFGDAAAQPYRPRAGAADKDGFVSALAPHAETAAAALGR